MPHCWSYMFFDSLFIWNLISSSTALYLKYANGIHGTMQSTLYIIKFWPLWEWNFCTLITLNFVSLEHNLPLILYKFVGGDRKECQIKVWRHSDDRTRYKVQIWKFLHEEVDVPRMKSDKYELQFSNLFRQSV